MDKNKEKILIHFENSVDFVKNLTKLTENEWYLSLTNDEWTIAGVVTHFIALDEFVLQKRIPYFKKDGVFPKELDKQAIKQQSLIESRKRKKEEIIEKFTSVRRSLIIAVNNLEDEKWSKSYRIHSSKYTISSYLFEYIHYDLKQFNKVREALYLKK